MPACIYKKTALLLGVDRSCVFIGIKEEKMVPQDLDRLIEKYLEGKCTDAERAIVESLYASLGGKSSADSEVPVDDQRAHRMLKNIRDHAQDADTNQDHPSRFWRYAGIAASLVFLLSVGYYFTKPETFKPTSGTEKAVEAFSVVANTSPDSKRVILPDGSIVQLSPESRIRYAPHNNHPTRELMLEGEAYFDVAHNPSRPFYVYAGDVVAKVLGTSFTVRARGGDEKVTVSVRTGKVSVHSRKASHKKTVLTPNQEAVYDNVTDLVATQEAPVSKTHEQSARLAEMHFEETPIPHVLEVLSKTYSIDIAFDERTLSGCVLTSSFYEEGLYDRIDVICTAIGATYSVKDARIFIESKGCNLKSE